MEEIVFTLPHRYANGSTVACMNVFAKSVELKDAQINYGSSSHTSIVTERCLVATFKDRETHKKFSRTLGFIGL